MPVLHDFSATRIDGAEQSLAEYAGQVVLVVNTASKCGLTPQFEGLEALYREFGADGLVVLGFPCGQFAGQEPLDEGAIAEFCSVNYGVTFPMFAKVDVNGRGAHPLFVWLKSRTRGLTGGAVRWNFTKFLVGRDGRVIARFRPSTAPAALAKDIRAALRTSAHQPK
ncbi:glutathione peroxidase [Demequina sp.]|uniref:glutathione peroxidase n=1 Tax=Demequina sp. TaxID=2050685 RepID=UPI0025F6F8A0|nr:glutathione peroxidase [Demequina sp.]